MTMQNPTPSRRPHPIWNGVKVVFGLGLGVAILAVVVIGGGVLYNKYGNTVTAELKAANEQLTTELQTLKQRLQNSAPDKDKSAAAKTDKESKPDSLDKAAQAAAAGKCVPVSVNNPFISDDKAMEYFLMSMSLGKERLAECANGAQVRQVQGAPPSIRVAQGTGGRGLTMLPNEKAQYVYANNAHTCWLAELVPGPGTQKLDLKEGDCPKVGG